MKTYVERMATLEAAVAAVNAARVGGDEAAYKWYRALDFAIDSGWCNADDTMRDEREAPNDERRAELAYGSICCSSAFEREDVRAWFKANGYEW